MAAIIYFAGAIQFAIALNGSSYSRHLIHLVISLELVLLSIALLLVNMSFYFDDLLGATLALYLLPLAGAESAVALALLVAFYPARLNLLIARPNLSSRLAILRSVTHHFHFVLMRQRYEWDQYFNSGTLSSTQPTDRSP